jgi:DnaJ-class molecular chaperone
MKHNEKSIFNMSMEEYYKWKKDKEIEEGICQVCHGYGRIDWGGTFSTLDCGKCDVCNGTGKIK